MEVIKAKDLYFQPRVDNLTKELQKSVAKIDEISDIIDNYLDSNVIDMFQLNILLDHKQNLEDTKKAVENQIQRIKLETLN
jgi:hypothetical protein